MKNDTVLKISVRGLLAVAMFHGVGSGYPATTVDYEYGEIDETSYIVPRASDSLILHVADGYGWQAGALSGAGSVTKTGSGYLILSAANSYEGDTFVNEGFLELCGPQAQMGHAASRLTVSGTASAFLVTAGARIEGSVLSLSGSDGEAVFGSASGGDWSGGRFQSSRMAFDRVEIGSSGSAAFTVVDGGQVTSSTVSIGEASFVTVIGGSSAGGVVYNSSWENSGDFTVNGKLTVALGAALETESILVGRDGELNIGRSEAPTAAGHVSAEVVDLRTTGSVLNFNQSDEVMFSSFVKGRGKIIQRGAGTAALGGENDYSGGTEIHDGELRAASNRALGTGEVEVSGGVLDTGTYVLGNDVAVTGGALQGGGALGKIRVEKGIFSPSKMLSKNLSLGEDAMTNLLAGPDFSHISVDGDLLFGGVLRLTLAEGFMPGHGMEFDFFDWSGIAGGSFAGFSLPTLAGGNNWDLSTLYQDGTIRVVPEPTTWMLMAVGGTLVFFLRLRGNRFAK